MYHWSVAWARRSRQEAILAEQTQKEPARSRDRRRLAVFLNFYLLTAYLLVAFVDAAGFAAGSFGTSRDFTDFGFTREVQQVMADSEGLYTGHPEVTYPSDKPKLTDLRLLTADPEELEKRNEEIKQRFVEFFGA